MKRGLSWGECKRLYIKNVRSSTADAVAYSITRGVRISARGYSVTVSTVTGQGRSRVGLTGSDPQEKKPAVACYLAATTINRWTMRRLQSGAKTFLAPRPVLCAGNVRTSRQVSQGSQFTITPGYDPTLAGGNLGGGGAPACQQVRDALYNSTTKGAVTSSKTLNNHLSYGLLTVESGSGGDSGTEPAPPPTACTKKGNSGKC